MTHQPGSRGFFEAVVDLVDPERWLVFSHSGPSCQWISVRSRVTPFREQGLKLHLSAVPQTAEEVLQRAAPVLLEGNISFKFAATQFDLQNLLNGRGGLTQVGKFLTIYPPDSEEAVRLGLHLEQLTSDLSGPHIPYEPALGPQSIVHYRYGAFARFELQQDIGRIVHALKDPDGQLRLDDRSSNNSRSDAFAEAGVPVWQRTYETVLRDRYLRLETLAENRKGLQCLGLDIGNPKLGAVVIKEAHAGVALDANGLDGRGRLENEACALRALKSCPRVPTFVDFWHAADKSFLVYCFVEGTNLASLLGELANSGRSLSVDQLWKWASSLWNCLREVHCRGLLFGDLKPSNIIVDRTGELHLIDFELAQAPESGLYPGFGTRGYSSPEQLTGQKLGFQDDIYAYGSTLLSMITMRDLSLFPEERIELVYRDAVQRCPELTDLVLNAMHPHRERRPTLVEIGRRLSREHTTGAIGSDLSRGGPACAFLQCAIEIGEALVREQDTEEDGLWVTQHSSSFGAKARDVYVGSSGVALFLLELYDASGERRFLASAAKAAEALKNDTRSFGRPQPLTGLYFGECGVSLLNLRLYELTGRSQYRVWAEETMDLVRSIPSRGPDILTGAAGTGLSYLMLYRSLGDRVYYDAAVKTGLDLLGLAETDGVRWRIPPGFEGLSGNCYLGFAHGSAGIGYFFAELFAAGGDSRFLDCAERVSNWLEGLARPALDDDSGLTWPDVEGGKSCLHWCHGSTGIAVFLLQMYRVTRNDRYLELANRAGLAAGQGGRWACPIQCHGLAGYIELLLDLFQENGRPEYGKLAWDLGELLEGQGISTDGNRAWAAETKDCITSDFMVGQAGVGNAFLRLGTPYRPGLLHPHSFNRQRVADDANLLDEVI